jgi:hypothetical protein
MSTAVIVAIAIWNGLLLAGLVAVICWRRQLPSWVTSLDGWRPPPQPQHFEEGDARWAAFLAEHPELLQLEAAIARKRVAPGRRGG